MPRINLLPREIGVRRRERRLQRVLIAVAAGLVLLLIAGTAFLKARESHERDVLAEEQARTEQVRAEVNRLEQYGQLEQTINSRRGVLTAALTGDVAWSKFLNDVSLIMPDNSWLLNMALAATAGVAPNGVASLGTTTFQGVTFDFPGLAGWLTRMAQIEGLTFVYLSSGTRQVVGSSNVVNFAANANVTQALLSQRCQANQRCP